MPLATARGVPERSLIALVRGVISLRFTLCAIDRPHGSKRERAVGMQIRDRQHVSLPRWNEYTQSLETAGGQKPPPEGPSAPARRRGEDSPDRPCAPAGKRSARANERNEGAPSFTS